MAATQKTSKKLTIRVISPSSSARDQEFFASQLAQLRASGHTVRYDAIPFSDSWPAVAGPAHDRARQLTHALVEPDTDVIFCIRGGYGASDLFPLLDWEKLKREAKPKYLVGFSDICALHSALFVHLGWRHQLIHGPMIGSTLWGKNGVTGDVDNLWKTIDGSLKSLAIKGAYISSVPNQEIRGWLFGGNLSTLTNLIGTPFLPRSLAGAVLFLEDLGEPPGRLARQFNQWRDSNLLQGVAALVLGRFTELPKGYVDDDPRLLRELASRSGLPTFHIAEFGHVSPNQPLPYGAHVTLSKNQLSWDISAKSIV